MENVDYTMTEQGVMVLKVMADKILTDRLCELSSTKEGIEDETKYITDLRAKLEDELHYRRTTSPEQFKSDVMTSIFIMNRGMEFAEQLSKIKR